MTLRQSAARVAANLRAAREAAGLTQAQAARLIDAAPSQLCEWEAGTGRVPRADRYLAILAAYAAHAATR